MLPVLVKKSRIEVDCNSVRIFVLVKSAGAVSQSYGHLRVSGIPIPKNHSDTGIPAKFFSLAPYGHVRLARFARECHGLLGKPIFKKTRSCSAV